MPRLGAVREEVRKPTVRESLGFIGYRAHAASRVDWPRLAQDETVAGV
jgi:hypothetical protein